MKLSTAIRIGSMTTKQIAFHATDGKNGRCAIGAALDAVGVVTCDWVTQARRAFPILDQGGLHLLARIVNMNDRQRYTREQIADYVERYENEHDGYLQTGVTESKPLEAIAMEAK